MATSGQNAAFYSARRAIQLKNAYGRAEKSDTVKYVLPERRNVRN